jgi:hypothetical protein
MHLEAQTAGSLAELSTLVKQGQGVVVTDIDNHKIKGRFFGVAGDALILSVPEERRVPADRILNVKRRDPVWTGAAIGALVMGGVCAFVCGQGVDSRNQWLPAVAANAGLGALIGLRMDAMTGNDTLLQRGPPPSTHPRTPTASLSFRLRF